MKRCKVNNMASEIASEIARYRDDVTDKTKRDVKEVARECRDDIRERSPRKTGEYAKGWTDKVAFEDKDALRVTVYNSKKHQIAHLLEYGHVKAGGGRVAGRPHIAPAEQAAEEKLGKKVRVTMKG